MKYAYEDLSWEQFEELVVLICQELLGLGTRGFATGPDGGRDARFDGKANCFPSLSRPWEGTCIIQAKHTNGINKSFSESDFFSPTNSECTILKEIPRIKKLIDRGELNHYILFANRKLTGNTDSAIIRYISESCELAPESISLCGLGQLEYYLKRYPHIPDMAGIDPVESPLVVSPDDLAVIIEAMGAEFATGEYEFTPPVPRTSYEDKNRINNMTPEYASALRSRYLKEVKSVHGFLSAPENSHLMDLYESIADEFQLKIVARRKDFQEFDRIIEYLTSMLFNRDVDLSKNKRLTRVMLFYMYWNCDLGMNNEIES